MPRRTAVPQEPKEQSDALVHVQALTAAKQKATELKDQATILFTDLCDSTSYKLQRSPIDGLAKAYLHNDAATQAVQKYGGIVVKYIGDEVMARFTGKREGAEAAVRAAIELHKVLEKYNHEQNLEGIEKVFSKTGIHQGDVWDFQFEGHDAKDPQGSTVDRAARVTGLAKRSQILCTSDIRDSCRETDIKFSNAHKRLVKGIETPLQVHEVLQEAVNPSGVAIGLSLNDEKTRNWLGNARLAEERDELDEAIKQYSFVLEHDPDHFVANVLLARIYLRQKNEYIKAQDYSKKAVEANPSSALARQIYAVSRWYVGADRLSAKDLDELIFDIEKAIEDAHYSLDFQTRQLARQAAARFYANRYELTKNPDDLRIAIDRCESLTTYFERQKTIYTAAFLETYAYALSHKDDRESLEKALKIVSEAEALAPRNSYPAATRAAILRKLENLENVPR